MSWIFFHHRQPRSVGAFSSHWQHNHNYNFFIVGSVDATGAVEVTNSFTVPHNEVEDEVSVLFYKIVHFQGVGTLTQGGMPPLLY